jgi:benzylsuccinate CoA-transferase BbsE subunit
MLSGLRALDLTDASGFLAGKILGDLGVDVVKVEPPSGDPARRAPFLGGVEDPERSLPWLALNTSKRGVTLDLDQPRGRELLRRLLPRFDVVLESGDLDALALESRGLGWESQREACPRLVWCSITPFGRSGPRARWRAGDLVVVAMGGNMLLTGDADRPPVRCTLPTSVYHSAPEAALGAVMALSAREETGRGQLVDVSMQECQLQSLLSAPGQFAASGRATRRGGARLGRTREIWAAKDGWVSFGLRGGPSRIPNLQASVAFMTECGMAPRWLREYDWGAYNHNTVSDGEIERLEEVFGAFFRSKTMRELYEEALRRRMLLAPCNDAREIAEHPQLRDRGLFVTLEYPELGAALEIEHPGGFAKTDGGELRIRRRAPRRGEHNAEVLGEIGVSADELRALAAEGVV